MMKRPFSALAVTVLMVVLGAAAHASSYQFKVPLKGIAPPADWQPHEPLYGDWEDVGDVFGCSNWAPAPMTVAVNQPFTQTATDCQQDQMRTVQPRERDTRSGAIRNAGEPFTETRTLTASATRDAVGTKETWSAAEAIYSVWKNSGEPYGCTSWSPDPATVTAGTTFTQTRSCSQNQTRTRQDREYEPTLGQYRNVGAPVTETQTVVASQSREATGTQAAYEFKWNDSDLSDATAAGCSGGYYVIWYHGQFVLFESGSCPFAPGVTFKGYEIGPLKSSEDNNGYLVKRWALRKL